MSNDQRFERNARAWLELGPTDAPDRVVEAALIEIDQTSQERGFRVPWRLPIMSLATRSAAIAVVAVVALGAALVFYRSAPGSVSPSASPTATPAPSPTEVTMAQFKLARDTICSGAAPAKASLEPRFTKIFDAKATAAEKADGIAALAEFMTLSSRTTDQLAQLPAPPSLREAQAANVAQYRDIIAILEHELELLHAGKMAEAQAVDITTDAISQQISSWEAQYNFFECP